MRTSCLLRVSTVWGPSSSLAFYEQGVRQGMQMPSAYLASVSPWRRWMGVGPVTAGAVEIRPASASSAAAPTILFAGNVNGRSSGWDVVLAGLPPTYGWMDGVEGAPAFSVSRPYAAAITIAPSNYDFTVHGLPVASSVMAADDIRSLLTPIYGSTAGALHSYDYAPEGRIAPCITINGGNCYGNSYNFFDPDSFLSIASMVTTFDADVWAEASKLLITNGAFLCQPDTPVPCSPGQMLHHFVDNCNGDPMCYCAQSPFNPAMQDCVTYAAISGASQTGPNIFWTLASLRFAAVTGNMTWLTQQLPELRYSMYFLLQRFDPAVGLFKVPGSLFIDTFIRANYTSDTNAAMVWLLREFADAERAVNNATGAALYEAVAATVLRAMPAYLWHPTQRDHFCTNSNPGASAGQVEVCARDFVDYDSNLLAVAVGMATGSDATALLARVDSGACTHARGTWVSEVYYDAANCNDGNTGDSAVSMGRIAYVDALARQAVGGPAAAAAFEELVFGPLQDELLASTWMAERHQCQGVPTHNNYYIEMGECVSMMLMEVRWGVRFGWSNLTVAPLSTTAFALALPGITLAYDSGATGSAPVFSGSWASLSGTRAIVVGGLTAGTYLVTVAGAPFTPLHLAVGNGAMLVAPAVPVGPGVVVNVVAQ